MITMYGKILSLVLLVCVLTTSFAAPVAGQVGLDNSTDNGTSAGTSSDAPQNESNDSEAAVTRQSVDVSPILTVNKAEWYSGNNTVVVTVTAEQSHEVTKVWQEGDGQFRKETVTVPEGQSKVLVNSNGYDKVQLWSQNAGRTLESPNIDLLDLPPSQWIFTWIAIPSSLIGGILAILHKYAITDHVVKNESWDLSDIDPLSFRK